MVRKPTKTKPRFPNLLPVAGVRIGAIACGVKVSGRDDLMMAEFPDGASVAGVFTRSRTAAANIEWCRKALAHGSAGVLVANSGNANAFTGKEGVRAVKATAAAAAGLAGCRQKDVFIASTGVIGEPLPVARITAALPKLHRSLGGGGWRAAADAIRTTDTHAKGCCRVATIDGRSFVINGIAKGSGMVAPNMATMLGFLFTNATLPAQVLQTILKKAVAESFNCITVDGDTSTSDMVLAFATGQGGDHDPILRAGDKRLADFRAKLGEVTLDLAHQIVRDGEGAGKFITVQVSGAASALAARAIALQIANSPLVKTAVAGADPNWGRIVMAAGNAGQDINLARLVIRIGGCQVTRNGKLHPAYDEAEAAAHMAGSDIDLSIDVGVGRGSARVWSCDFTKEYIRINADYRS